MNKVFPVLFMVLLGSSALACGGATGPRVRVAEATAADLEAVRGEKTVWYEFRKGDVVPFQFVMIGAAQSATEPVQVLAAQDFWLVMSEGSPMYISFDGKTFSGAESVELVSLIVPGEDDKAKLIWINYFGAEGSAGEELERLLKSPPSGDAATPAEPEGEAEAVGVEPPAEEETTATE
jgi:hypothetical protein